MKSLEVARLTDEGELKQFMTGLLERSSAEQTEVMVTEWDSALTRFANNGIHQNVAERDASVRVRVVKDGRTGVVPMPGPAPARPVEAWSDATAAVTPEDRADFVQTVCAKAGHAGLKAFGAYSTSAAQFAIANSLGVFHHQRSTQATVNSVVMGDAGSGYADRGAIDVRELDKDDLATEVIEKAQRNQNAQPVEPGVYEVVLEEYAVAEMLEFMSFIGFGALAVQEERSFMRLGERITGEEVSIWDDALDRTGIPASFDFEGVPKQRVDLITGGVASGLVYDMQTATRAGRQSTGHGLPAPNTEGPFAVNLFMKPGGAAKADLMGDIKRGIWVTRFWYVRVVQPKASIITGMTREGTFLIENGKITRPVKDLRFTQSILEALNGTLALTRSTKLQVSEYLGASRVPAVRLKAFDFTS
jgi:predicted Zn-dependent protease